MNTVAANPVAQATLFDTYAPVERYFQDLRAQSGVTPTPPVQLPAEDAYLLHALLGFHASIHAVLDLAAEATWGATTVLLAAHERHCRVYAPELGEDVQSAPWT